MKLGDLVKYQDKLWLVNGSDKQVRTVYLSCQDGTQTEIADQLDRTDPDTVKVVANPSEQWNLLTSPVCSGFGPLVKMTVPGVLGRKERVLTPWVEWIPSDPLRGGGSIFVHPSIKLLPGMVLFVTHKNGSINRINVPKVVGSVKQRQKLAQQKRDSKKKDSSTCYSMLDKDDE